MPADPKAIAAAIGAAAEKLQTVLATHHGLFRGTMETVMAEAQGAN